MASLALLAAETVDLAHQGASAHDAKCQEMADSLSAALGLDMRSHWEATREFWEQTPKSYIIEALAASPPIANLSEAARKTRTAALAKLKKSELARSAAKAMQTSGWLPEPLIAPPLEPSAA